MSARPTTLPIASEADLVGAVTFARDLARRLGLSDVDQARCATAVSELARNVLKYARHGKITLGPVERVAHGLVGPTTGFEALVEDRGPGIPDLERAMTDHFSSGGSLGLGLGGVKRLMDDFELRSSAGQGTSVRIRKWK